MTGTHDLDTLLASMDPVMDPEVYVFVTLEDRRVPSGITPRMTFQEAEGTTLILSRTEAEAAALPYTFASRMITLNVHSALEAVGFIARIATALAEHGMGVNPVAGYFHDHLFVPEDRADDAMRVLRTFTG
ncbi:ACT domain-containing protein [Roseovarius sp. ZX-A-9]|uniref:ACT domain-containing protein n=1 Tax=Roseovarius sp. ZX-A-9 TaxID=3014783 RepID=UPI002330EBC4|nr:ACT domain-containing protein [Roseovarius sp. ZX-A-9]MDX1786156.1 ACT domain-containing protein [Roseovarius sp.]